MIHLAEVTKENIYSKPIVTEELSCYFNFKFSPSLMIDIDRNECFEALCEILEEDYSAVKTYTGKDGLEHRSLKMKISPDVKIFNEEKKEVFDKFKGDLSKLLRNVNVRLVFKAIKYNFKKESGVSLKVIQIQIKPREKEVLPCMFD